MKLTIQLALVVVLAFGAPVFAQLPADEFATRLVDAAMDRLSHNVIYDGSYRRIVYPNGDVPDHLGVCTDLVVRAYRAVGIDLQQAVHEDMKANFPAYPKIWGHSGPDANIDHRRVPNLMTFFSRFGHEKLISTHAADYKPGDLVTWDLGSGLRHIGIVIDQLSRDSLRPLIVHNIGAGQEISDCLFNFKIIGHYSFGQ